MMDKYIYDHEYLEGQEHIKNILNRILFLTALILPVFWACGYDSSDDDGNGVETTTYTLTVTAPTNGTIVLAPEAAGNEYSADTVVTITAVPVADYVFREWTGDLSGSTNPTAITMGSDKTIGATFGEPSVLIPVKLATATGGTYTTDPAITSGEGYADGTEIEITATPDTGYVLDSIFKIVWIISPFWAYYMDESPASPYTVTVDIDDERFSILRGKLSYTIGAYFVADDTWGDLDETFDVVYATPGVKPLKYDVYAPTGASDLPIVVIIHGGGWSMNTEDIMRGPARYIAESGRYVVVSIDYRLTSDPDVPAPTQLDCVNDTFGAIAHIMENSATYGGDAANLAVTGDSAGGHLAAVVTVMADKVGTDYTPTYIPSGMTAADVGTAILAAVKSSAPSYGVFKNYDTTLSPQDNIPDSGTRVLAPQHCQVGENDTLVSPERVQTYVDALTAAGQAGERLVIAGASHAYLDWKPNDGTIHTFNTIGKPALDSMIAFFDETFYP